MATLKQERDAYSQMYGTNCVLLEDEGNTDLSREELLKDCDEAIFNYSWMLQAAIDRNDRNEIALLKKELQEAKCEKRRILAA